MQHKNIQHTVRYTLAGALQIILGGLAREGIDENDDSL
jgi:hypothetical protein